VGNGKVNIIEHVTTLLIEEIGEDILADSDYIHLNPGNIAENK